ncbi:MAG: cell division topological specificity factor MinE [Proteobacteria bacterium]|nr:cell division topological specificity factor MinE [Pseudomonadota bacterium]
MKLLDLFRFFQQRRTPAEVAKERLQIIVSHESARKCSNDFIKELQAELIEVISKYIKVDQELIKVQLERNGDHSVLELNVTLPEGNALMKEQEMTS